MAITIGRVSVVSCTLNLAREQDQAGNWRNCLPLYSDAVIDLQTRCPNKVEVAEAYALLGRAQRRLSHYDDAKKSLRIALEGYRTFKSEQGSQNVFALCELAQVCMLCADLHSADALLQQALSIQSKCLPSGHIEIARTLFYQAELNFYQNDLARALDLGRSSLALFCSALGNASDQYGEVLAACGVYKVHMGRLEEAERDIYNAIGIRESALGANHPEVASNLNNLASCLLLRGKYQSVESLLDRSLKIAKEKVGNDHSIHGVAILLKALLFARLGRLNESLEYANNSLRTSEAVFGTEHIRLTPSLNLLTVLYKALEREADFEVTNARIKSLLETKLAAERHTDISGTICLANKYHMENNYVHAHHLIQRALNASRDEFGSQSLKTASVLNLIAGMYFREEDWTLAKDYYVQELAIREGHPQSTEAELAAPLLSLGLCYLNQNDRTTCMIFRERARAIEEKFGLEDRAVRLAMIGLEQLKSKLGDDHPAVTARIATMASILDIAGSTDQAEELFDDYIRRRAREYSKASHLLQDLWKIIEHAVSVNNAARAEQIASATIVALESKDWTQDLLSTHFLFNIQMVAKQMAGAVCSARLLAALVLENTPSLAALVKADLLKKASLIKSSYPNESALISDIAQGM